MSEHGGHQDSEKGRHAGDDKGEEVLKVSSTSVLYGILLLAVIFIGYNQFLIQNANAAIAGISAVSLSSAPAQTVAPAAGAQAVGAANAQAGDASSVEKLAAKVIPRGIPAIYGKELGVSFEDPVKGMAVLASYDNLQTGPKSITFSSMPKEAQERYLRIATKIACEYCCGAQSLIAKNGEAACGCAHSAAMRGLAKYLLKNHSSEYTDDQVLEELGKWKALFFPKQTIQKAALLENNGIELSFINLESNKYRDTSNLKKVPSSGGLASIPDMVGGC